MYSKSSWGRVFLLACFLGVVLLGPYRIMEFLYQAGVYPAVTKKEVLAALQRSMPGIEGATCQQNVAGWEYVCDYIARDQAGRQSPQRGGIRTSWLTPIRSMTPLPAEGPVLTPAESAKERAEHARRAAEDHQRRLEPVNLRTATIADLRRVPLVDQYLAEQIYAGVRGGTVSRVDDLLKVKGIDQPRLDIIRQRVRWE